MSEQSDSPSLVWTVGGLSHLFLLFGPQGARINSDQVASDTPNSTIGEFYMTEELLFWKTNQNRNRTVISDFIYTLSQLCSVEEGERTQQRNLVESSSEIHLRRITFKLLSFHFPGEICGTFRWFTAASFHPSVFGVRRSPGPCDVKESPLMLAGWWGNWSSTFVPLRGSGWTGPQRFAL